MAIRLQLKDPPTEPGFYYAKDAVGGPWMVVELIEMCPGLCFVCGIDGSFDVRGFCWFGKVDPLEELKP